MQMGRNKDFKMRYPPIETIVMSKGSLKIKMATPMSRPIKWEMVKTKMLCVVIKTELVALGSDTNGGRL